MQEVTKEQMEALINEAKAEGKDVTALEAQLSSAAEMLGEAATEVVMGERSVKQIGTKKVVIESTGPAEEEDFQ